VVVLASAGHRSQSERVNAATIRGEEVAIGEGSDSAAAFVRMIRDDPTG